MKTYEMVYTMSQPTCGGKSPTKSEISTVTIEDPIAYVKSLEPDLPLEIEHSGETLIIRVPHNEQWARYEFTED